MKTRAWNIEAGGRLARSVLECGGPPPLSNRSRDSALQSARGLAQSKTWRIALLFCFSLLPLAFSLRALGQSYSIDWYKIAGGGGTSTGGTYQVTGTIGQPDAGGAMSGGNYSLTGGFWSLVSVAGPLLTISHSGNSVIVSWPNTGGYALQQNNNLAAPGGWTASGYPVTTSNGTNSITITPPAGTLFFRLRNP
jgi:hypothetical protein